MSLLTLLLPRTGGAVVPTVITVSVENITSVSALLNGNVVSDGGATVTQRGFVYSSVNPNPTLLDSVEVVSGTTGTYSLSLGGLASNSTYYFRAYATNSQGTTYGSVISFATLEVVNVHKHYFYKVYLNGNYINTWTQEVISEPQFKTSINSVAGEMMITLARDFDNFGEGTDVSLNNLVECYVVDKESPNGILLYTGYISGYKPIIREDNQYLEVTLFSLGAELSRQILTAVDGSTTITYNSTDPSEILKSVINLYRRRGGRLNYTSSTIDNTYTSVSYTFNTNTILECLNKIVELCPVGWYFRVSADGNIYLKSRHITADHAFTVGLDIENLETFRRVEDIVNRVLFTGGGDPPMFRVYQNTSSIATYGLYETRIIDERVTVTATAQTMANRLIDNQKDPEIRSVLTIVDSNGSSDLGYDIESVNVGDTLRIRNLRNNEITPSLWDIAQWDVDVWDQLLSASAVDVIQILSISYMVDSIVIEASSRLPQIAKRIEDINRNLVESQTALNPSSPS